jgi:hypothetical protein
VLDGEMSVLIVHEIEADGNQHSEAAGRRPVSIASCENVPVGRHEVEARRAVAYLLAHQQSQFIPEVYARFSTLVLTR